MCRLAQLFALVVPMAASPDPLPGLVRLPVKRASPQDTVLGGTNLQALGGSEDLQLANAMNMMYYSDIEVGTRGQTATVLFDTGSSDLWLPVGDPSLSRHRLFETSVSSTFVATDKPFHIRYGSGDVAGVYCQDTVTLGTLTLPNFTFAAVDETSGLRGFENWRFDGILGLGFRSLTIGDTPTVVEALAASGQLASPVFGFYLGDNSPGELVIGGVDPAHVDGEFHFVDVTPTGYWSFELGAVRLGDLVSLTSTRAGIVDSGSSLLVGPQRDVETLAAMLDAVKSQAHSSFYQMPCAEVEQAPRLAFVLGGQEFALDVADLVIERLDDVCLLGLQGSQHQHWILGDVFMRRYYVQFDFKAKRLGFARAASARAKAPNLV